jgi:hypothetical protein
MTARFMQDLDFTGASGGNRTRTPFWETDFKSVASTGFATLA